LRAAIDRAGNDGKAPGHSSPWRVRRRIDIVSERIEALHGRIDTEFAKEHPGRKPRMDLSSAGSAKR
jgi:hypothetical protein